MPFAITVDYDTVSDDTVTLRERDSTSQAPPPPIFLQCMLYPSHEEDMQEAWPSAVLTRPAGQRLRRCASPRATCPAW